MSLGKGHKYRLCLEFSICIGTSSTPPHSFTHCYPTLFPISKDWTLACLPIPVAASSIYQFTPLLPLISLSFPTFYWVPDSAPPSYTPCLYLCLFFPAPFTSPWRWRQHFPPKCWYPAATLCQSITTQKTLTWIFTTMKTSHLTFCWWFIPMYGHLRVVLQIQQASTISHPQISVTALPLISKLLWTQNKKMYLLNLKSSVPVTMSFHQ